MRLIFVDSAHYVAALSIDDDLHAHALAVAAELSGDASVQFITTDAVLVEVLAFYSRFGPQARGRTADMMSRVLEDPRVTVVPQTPALFDAGLDLYRRRPDKSYSMCDCMSMVVCAERGITDVLSADHDFEQEGLTLLL